jgi:rSAM/selenodomain-associated transferase 1
VSTALIVFAKAPVAGWAKTRLIPALGAEGAARLARQLLAHTLAQACDALGDGPDQGIDSLELCVTPDEGHPALDDALSACAAHPACLRHAAHAGRSGRTALSLTAQGSGDLGERMHRATARALRTHERVLLIGTDAPALDAKRLRQAAQSLRSHDAVFVPAHDGGYALVGLRCPAPELFAGVPWSTPSVMEITRSRARAAGLSLHELEAVHDVDVPEDLPYLPPAWAIPRSFV